MSYSPLIQKLIDAFCCLPGVGPKSAQRMAMHLLERQREAGLNLSKVLAEAVNHVGRCSRCRILTEDETCHICLSPQRDDAMICVVENPSDVFAIELSGEYRGRYFVLLGHLSPIDGIGPEQIGIVDLLDRIASDEVEEVILATSATIEGQTTAYYIQESLKNSKVKITKLAQGLPVGGEIENLDDGTLISAFKNRSNLISNPE